jgi:hypothetical protein
MIIHVRTYTQGMRVFKIIHMHFMTYTLHVLSQDLSYALGILIMGYV